MTGPVSANPHRETVRVEGVYRGAPSSIKPTARGARSLMADTLTTQQRSRPQIERDQCEVCLKMVKVRMDGTLSGHQASRGIQCVGASPVVQSGAAGSPTAVPMCDTHGEYRASLHLFACGCPAPRKQRGLD